MARKDFSAASHRLGEAAGRTSSAAHLKAIQRQYDAIARGDLEAALAQAAPDVTLDIFAPPEFEWVRHAQGVDELRRAIQQNFDSVDDQRPEITNVHAEGDVVVLFGRERGRIRKTGQPYDVEFVQRFTFQHDRLHAVRIIAAHVVPTP